MGGLPEAAVAHYREHGYYAPIRVMPVAEAERLRLCLEAHETVHGVLKGAMRHKSHLLFTWLDGLIRHPAILDAVEGVIGPDILCWSSTFFIKEARDPGFVSWHQDFHLLGAGSRRHRYGLGRTFGEHGRERRHARHPGNAEARSGRAPGYVRGK